jgi:hypothetical protein
MRRRRCQTPDTGDLFPLILKQINIHVLFINYNQREEK